MKLFTKQLIIGLIGYLVLLLWNIATKKSCLALIVIPIIVLILARSIYNNFYSKKVCLANCYFKKETQIYNFFRKKSLTIIYALFAGLFFTFILLIDFATMVEKELIIMLFDLVIIIFFYKYFLKNRSVNEDMRYNYISFIVPIVNATLLILLFEYLSFEASVPESIDNSLKETINKSLSFYNFSCSYLNEFYKIVTVYSAIKWWIMIKFSFSYDGDKTLFWILFLFSRVVIFIIFTKYIITLLNYIGVNQNERR